MKIQLCSKVTEIFWNTLKYGIVTLSDPVPGRVDWEQAHFPSLFTQTKQNKQKQQFLNFSLMNTLWDSALEVVEVDMELQNLMMAMELLQLQHQTLDMEPLKNQVTVAAVEKDLAFLTSVD